MNYPTDEELSHLIDYLENEPLYDPPHLKEGIIDRVLAITPTSFGVTDSVKNRKLNTFIYNLKVITATAAALLLIFTLPQRIEEADYSEQFYEHRLEAKIDKMLDEVDMTIEESRFDRIFRIGTSAINETADMFLDKINSLNNFNEDRRYYEN